MSRRFRSSVNDNIARTIIVVSFYTQLQPVEVGAEVSTSQRSYHSANHLVRVKPPRPKASGISKSR